MTSILEQQVTIFLTSALGRVPTAAEIANGLISPWTLSQVHNTLNVPQSVLVIGTSDDVQAAIDKLYSNGGGVLNLPPGNFLLTSNILIPTGVSINGAGPTNTFFIGSAGFSIKAHGISGTHLTDISLMNLGFTGGTVGSMVDFKYCDRIIFSNLLLPSNNSGITMDNCTQMNWSTVIVQASVGDGITVTNSSLMDWRSVNSESNGGAGLVLDTVSTLLVSPGDFEGNTGAGISMSTCSGVIILAESSNNGAEGLLLSTTSSSKINLGTYSGNGTYGINISDSLCVNNIIIGNTLSGNSTAEINDSGTGTLIRSNIGVADN